MRNKGYFQGWYVKCTGGDKTVAFIPAYHRSQNRTSASLQVITDDNAYSIPFEGLEYTKKPLSVKIGDCVFSEKGITLHYQSSGCKLEGLLRFRSLSTIAYDINKNDREINMTKLKASVMRMADALFVFSKRKNTIMKMKKVGVTKNVNLKNALKN